KGYSFDAEFVSRLVLNIGAPCLMLSTLSSVELDFEAFKRTALACVLISLAMAAAGYLVPRMMGRDVKAYMPSFVFLNSGNIGLPVCMLAYGDEGLALALSFFMVLSLAHFPVGTLLAGGKDAGGLTGVAKMPIFYAVGLAIVMLWQGWSLPAPVANSVSIIGGFSIPLMLIALGVSLQRLKIREMSDALIFSLWRLGGGFAVGWLISELLGMEGIEQGVVILQSSMPVAVFNYLFAERYQRAPEAVAGMVVMSTLLSFGTIPLTLWWLL
ncbi:MAG: AEC family transporter, partial [Oceanobacter sp.]